MYNIFYYLQNVLHLWCSLRFSCLYRRTIIARFQLRLGIRSSDSKKPWITDFEMLCMPLCAVCVREANRQSSNTVAVATAAAATTT